MYNKFNYSRDKNNIFVLHFVYSYKIFLKQLVSVSITIFRLVIHLEILCCIKKKKKVINFVFLAWRWWWPPKLIDKENFYLNIDSKVQKQLFLSLE